MEFALEQVLRNDTLDALPTVLARLVTAFSGRCALAFQPRTGQPPVVLAAHPDSAAADQVLLSRLGALSPAPGGTADSGSLQAPLGSGPPGLSALLASSAPAGGQCLCALALVGDASHWDQETRSVLNAVATAVAAQIRHANDAANLADQQALAQTLITGSPDAIVAMDSRGRLVAFNPAAEELSGYRRDAVLGQEMSGLLIPERERAAFLAHTKRYLATGNSSEYAGRPRVPMLCADGTERIVELTAAELTQDGETFFCGFLRDLTELEHSQAAVAETEARFRLLAQLAPVGIMQSDARGRAVFVNDRCCTIAGVRPKDALGTDWLDLVLPDDRERVAGDLAAAASKGELRTECRLRSSDRGGIWVQASAVALHAAGHAPLGFLATLTDISEVKRAAAERERLLAAEQAARLSLADQTERLNCLIANAIPGVLFTDEQGRITHVNQSFATMFGIEAPDPLVRTAASELVLRIMGVFADPDEFVRRTAKALLARQPVAGEQMTAADGRTLECDYWPVVVGGRYRGDLWLAWDITERKQLEERREQLLEAELAARRSAELGQRQLEMQNEKLRELDEAKTIFLGTVSHELRTPLTSIVSFSELMRAETQALTADGAQFLDIIERNAHRLLRLVGDLLLLNRLESGTVPLELAPVSIPELAGEAARAAAAGTAKHGVTVHFSADDGPPLQADRTRLSQVLDNLIANAIKFSRSNGLVRVDAVWDGSRWRIDVADNGMGIPPEEIGQLFGRFVRASNARTAGVPGTGLGLSIVKAITELHGGHVTVDSTLGHGTTFSVYLPAHLPATGRRAPHAERGSGSGAPAASVPGREEHGVHADDGKLCCDGVVMLPARVLAGRGQLGAVDVHGLRPAAPYADLEALTAGRVEELRPERAPALEDGALVAGHGVHGQGNRLDSVRQGNAPPGEQRVAGVVPDLHVDRSARGQGHGHLVLAGRPLPCEPVADVPPASSRRHVPAHRWPGHYGPSGLAGGRPGRKLRCPAGYLDLGHSRRRTPAECPHTIDVSDQSGVQVHGELSGKCHRVCRGIDFDAHPWREDEPVLTGTDGQVPG